MVDVAAVVVTMEGCSGVSSYQSKLGIKPAICVVLYIYSYQRKLGVKPAISIVQMMKV